MTDRLRPPDRRPSLTRSFSWKNFDKIIITVGFYKNGGACEVFIGGLADGDLADLMSESCMIISYALQAGVGARELADRVSWVDAAGKRVTASLIGMIINEMAKVEAEDGEAVRMMIDAVYGQGDLLKG